MPEKTMSIAEVVAEVEERVSFFLTDARKETNKAAAKRARKLSMEITKLLKTYREISIK
jgi:hypothetical protein